MNNASVTPDRRVLINNKSIFDNIVRLSLNYLSSRSFYDLLKYAEYLIDQYIYNEDNLKYFLIPDVLKVIIIHFSFNER